MKLGLVVATKNEFTAIFKFRNIENFKLEQSPFPLFKIILEGKEIYAINCGIGEINSALATQHLIDKYGVDTIINYGVVGSLVDDLDLNSTVIIDKIFDYELDLKELDGTPLGYHQDFDSVYLTPSQDLLELVKKNFPNIPHVTCASGNKFLTEPKFKDYLHDNFGCLICEMESLGILIASLKHNCRSIFIKGVSDTKNGGLDEYYKMVDESAGITFEILTKIIKLL
jgi:adenosylhomocysteine nucleosidase